MTSRRDFALVIHRLSGGEFIRPSKVIATFAKVVSVAEPGENRAPEDDKVLFWNRAQQDAVTTIAVERADSASRSAR